MAAADYSTLHARLVRTASKRGADVTFSAGGEGVYDPDTDTWAGGATGEVAGKAIQIKDDPERYAAKGLVLVDSVSLFFVPNTLGQVPGVGSSVAWGGATRTVKAVEPVAPSGTAIGATVVLA
jgi:hypothetical protein